MKLSGSQRLIKWFSSATRFEKMMNESMQWKFTCKNCSQVSSIWDAGGIRYKAAGNPTTKVKCIHCGKAGMHKITRAPVP